jgi:anaerobic dimethyl sulfoxide reductase subunit A
MMRVGERGEGKFKRVSWDEALDFVAEKMTQLKQDYGPTALLDQSYAGASYGVLHKSDQIEGLLGASWACSAAAPTPGRAELPGHHVQQPHDLRHHRGRQRGRRLRALEADHHVGLEPGLHLPRRQHLLLHADGQAARLQVRAGRSAVHRLGGGLRRLVDSHQAQHRRGHDGRHGAHIFSENLQDQAFIDRFVLGHGPRHHAQGMRPRKNFKDYILGTYDGVPKTAEWAEAICGVKAEDIRKLARLYATTKPAALKASGRRAAPLRRAVQPHGGGAAGHDRQHRRARRLRRGRGQGLARRGVAYPYDEFANIWYASIKSDRWAHCVLNYPNVKREEVGLWPRDDALDGKIPNIKGIFWQGSDWFNQLTNINKEIEAVKKLELVVCMDATITPRACGPTCCCPSPRTSSATTWPCPGTRATTTSTGPRSSSRWAKARPTSRSSPNWPTGWRRWTRQAEGLWPTLQPARHRRLLPRTDAVDEAYLVAWWDKVMPTRA